MQTRYFERFLLAKLSDDEMVALDSVDPSTFLAPNELLRDASMRLPIARRQFRAGRVALKTAILAVRNARASETIAFGDALKRDDYASLDVGSRNELNRGVAPTLLDVEVGYARRSTDTGDCGPRGSLAHVPTAAVAIYPLDPSDALGVDLVEFGSVRRNMLDLFFTESEREWLSEPDVWATKEQDVVWAVKEAAYKAVSRKSPFNPNQIEVIPASDGRYRACVEGIVLSAFVVERDRDRATVIAIR